MCSVSPLQGLFERHKLIVATQLCMAVLRSRGELQRQKFEFLLRGPKEMGVDNPLTDWVSESVWGSVQALKELEDYASLPDDLVGSSKRWREWMELERPGGCGCYCHGCGASFEGTAGCVGGCCQSKSDGIQQPEAVLDSC